MLKAVHRLLGNTKNKTSLGCSAVLAKSFARIHETNLKKQGILALTFENPDDYDRLQQGDKVSLIGLNALAPNKPVKCIICHENNETEEISLVHSYNDLQLEWFRAGSALNMLRHN